MDAFAEAFDNIDTSNITSTLIEDEEYLQIEAPRVSKRNNNGEPIHGNEFQIHRMLDPNRPCGRYYKRYSAGSCQTPVLDAYVARYRRERGFEMFRSDAERYEVQEYAILQRAMDECLSVERRPNSSLIRTNLFSYFECFVLKELPTTEFAQFLKQIEEPMATLEQVRFMKPNQTTVLAYLMHMREKRKNKYNTIRGFLVALSMVCIDCGSDRFTAGTDIKKMMEHWYEEDEEIRAAAFNPEEVL